MTAHNDTGIAIRTGGTDSRTSSRATRVNQGLILAFCGWCIVESIDYFPRDAALAYLSIWVYTDWLIDYSAGFIRRGLSGELFDILRFVPATTLYAALIWSIFAGVVAGYCLLVWRNAAIFSANLTAVVLFLPCLLPFYLYDHEAFGRKETVGYLLVLWHLWLLRKVFRAERLDKWPYYCRLCLPLTLLGLPAQLLLHEAGLLQFVPLHVVLSASCLNHFTGRPGKTAYLQLGLLYLPAAICFVCLYSFSNHNLETGSEICRHWTTLQALPAGLCDTRNKDPMWALPGALGALSWSFDQASSLSLSLHSGQILRWLIDFLLMGAATMLAGYRCHQAIMAGKTIVVGHEAGFANFAGKYFLVPLACSLPLYLMGWDLGRWFATSCINFMLLCLAHEAHCLEYRLSGLSPPARSRRPADCKYLLQTVALLVFMMLLRMPHSCNSGFNMFNARLYPLMAALLPNEIDSLRKTGRCFY